MVDVVTARPSRPEDDSLDRALEHGIHALGDLVSVGCVVQVARVEDRLRRLLEREISPHVAAAVTVACAHLAAGQLTDAHCALVEAQDHTRAERVGDVRAVVDRTGP